MSKRPSPFRTLGLYAFGAAVLIYPAAIRAQPADLANQTEPTNSVKIIRNSGAGTPGNAEEALRLEREIKARLEKDPWVLSYRVQAAAAKDGTVVLSGKVGTLLARKRAALVAGTIPGVTHIRNEIELSVPLRHDWEIRDEIAALFLHEPPLQSFTGKIEVNSGHAILSGYVLSAYRRELAERVADSVPGVKGVENELRVFRLAKPSDQEMQVDIASKLQWDPALMNPEIYVQVNHGNAELTGTVDTAAGKERAIQDARMPAITTVKADGLRVVGVATGGSQAP